jgi:PAT family beta-lactamase induction signal transducer AmpG
MNEPASTRPRLPDWVRAIGVYVEPKVLYVALLGFSSGLPLALTGSTLQAWMNRAGVDLTTIGFFALVGLPYSLKFLWAPLVDSVRLPFLSDFLGRRRSWLVASQVALAAALLILAGLDPAAAPLMLAVVALGVAFISATQDILVDTLRVEALEDRQQAAGVANYVAAYRVALLLTTSGALVLAGTLTEAGWGIDGAWGTVYLVAAGLMGVGLLGALLMPEPETPEDAPRLSGKAALLFLGGLAAVIWGLFYLRGTLFADHGRYFSLFVLALLVAVAGALLAWRARARGRPPTALSEQIQHAVIDPFTGFARDHKYWLGLLLLVVLFKFGDTFAGSLFTPFAQRIGFSDQAIGFALGWGIIATIVGGFLGAYVLRWKGLLIAMWIAGIVQLVSNFGYFALALIGANQVALMAAVLTENVMGGIGTTIFIALISALCRTRRFTASQFALLTALSAVPRTLLVSPAGMVAGAVGWPVFFILSAVAALPGIALLWWLGARGAIREKDAEGPA